MATVNFIPYKKQNKAALSGVAQYVSQSMKTLTENGRQLISGQNCSAQFAFREFVATREMHRKKSPVWFYHYTQSFHPDENITGEEAHAVAKEFAARARPESEVLIATHIDAAHIHSHFLVNAVCFSSGKMLRQGPDTLRKLRQISDEICMAHQLSVLAPEQQRKESKPSTREYRSAAKGESWKFRLMNMIDECMCYASSREEFVRLMRSEGYDVRWSASRKNITYTTPEGMKCRDARLHEKKYMKEVMEFEFRIRAEILYGRTAPEEQTDAAASGAVPGSDAAGHCDAMRYAAGDGGAAQSDPVPGGRYTVFTGESDNAAPCAEPEEGAHGDTPDTQAGGNTDATGWEEEREAFLASALSPPQNPYSGYVVAASPGWGGAAGSLVQLGKALEHGADPVPVRDSTTIPFHVDRKQRAKELEKKIALGHKADDHEEQQSYSQQTM